MLDTILEISKTLEENNIDYFLTGGTSLFLRKKIKTTNDIDFCIKKEDLKKAKEIFKKERVLMANKKAITFYKNGFEIELLLISEDKDKIGNDILKNKNYEKIKIKNKEINVISLKQLISMYRYIYLRDGKEKHLKRINLIEKLINS